MSVTSIVTGGAGFLGSHLVDALIARGHHVIVVDDLSTGRVANLAEALATGKATFVYADAAKVAGLLDETMSTMRVPRVNSVFHFASPASPQAYSSRPWETMLANSLGTMSLIDFAVHRGATFVYASTSEVYGDPLLHPQPESYFGNVDPIGPRACYDEGKRFGEAAVSVAATRRGLKARILRFFNCYGPRMDLQDGRLVPAFLSAATRGDQLQLHGTGRQTRSMTYVSDAVSGILTVLERFESWHPVNVGSDEELTVEDIAVTVAELTGVPANFVHTEPRPGDPQRRRPDLSILRSLGWEPRVAFREGIGKTLDWLQAGNVRAS